MSSRKIAWTIVMATGFWMTACSSVKSPRTIAVAPVPSAPIPTFAPSTWEKLPDWNSVDLTQSWNAMLQGCRALKSKPQWQPICADADRVDKNDSEAQRKFYEERMVPFQVFNSDGSESGTITGYYEPLLKGSRTRTERFRFPLYAVPDDMLEIDLGDLYPQLKGQRVRGRLVGKKVVPYFNRAEIDSGTNSLKGKELFWVDNAVDLFFLQIQGSGRIELPDGRQIKVGYADQNGQPYVSIGKKLVDMGAMKLEEASMQNIRAWGEKNPDKLRGLLELNPSYVFFRELPETLNAPLGALGVPLTTEYSIAVDPKSIPLGAPVFLATTQPSSNVPLNRLMLAQDTGGAIRGPVRADFFWGFGDKAGAQAGKMRQQGRMWVLFPKGSEPVFN